MVLHLSCLSRALAVIPVFRPRRIMPVMPAFEGDVVVVASSKQAPAMDRVDDSLFGSGCL